MGGIDLGLCPCPCLCPLGLLANNRLLWCLCLHCGASLASFLQVDATSHPTPHPHLLPAHPLSRVDPKLVRTSKEPPEIT